MKNAVIQGDGISGPRVESRGGLSPLGIRVSASTWGTKARAGDPVPFAIYDSKSTSGSGRAYTEKEAAETGDFVEEGHVLLG
jgi:hypothetical protein